MNYFYENILSSYYIEDNLMYLLTLLLKNEINKMKYCNYPDMFLDEHSICKYLLNELRKKSDIQGFFKTIIYEVVENLEIKYSENIIDFDINKKIKEMKLKLKNISDISKNTLNNKDTLIDKNGNKLNIDDIHNIPQQTGNNYSEIKTNNDIFGSKYLQNILKEDLETKLDEYKDNPNMMEYINNKIKQCNINKELFSNEHFLNIINNSNYSDTIYDLYKEDFMEVIDIIDKIFQNLISSIHLLPHSIKCLCKIISILLTKKFPNITTTQKNSFIGIFFFKILFSAIFKNPSIEALINDFIISRNTMYSLNVISEIIIQLVSGKFFTNIVFTPFNRYFLEKMPMIYTLFEKICDVNITPFIEKLINDQLEENYKYNYFDENEDEVISHRSVCYNLDNISVLLKNVDKCKDIIFSNGENKHLFKTFEKLSSGSMLKLLERLQKQENYENTKNIKNPKGKKIENINLVKNKKYFYLDTELLWNNNYKKLFSINKKNKKAKKIELNKSKIEDDVYKNNLIKVKNYLSILLLNYRKIKKNDFTLNKILNTENILKELKIFMNSSNFVIDGSIPSEWYINILLDYIKKVPNSYIENDYELLYSELEKDINNSIKELDFEALSVCIDKMKFTQRWINYYEHVITCILDVEQNEKAKQIIENEILPVEIRFAYSDTEKYFSIIKTKINKLKILDDMVYENSKSNVIICPTIDSFAKLFPNINKYECYNIPTFNIIEELNIPEYLLNYFKSTQIYLTKTQTNANSQEIENISNKIYDYTMNKLYKKLFPTKPDPKDLLIYKNSILLSWTEPKNFIKDKKTDYVFDTFLPDAIKYIRQIETEKSPRKKINNLSKVFNSITNLERFNGCHEAQGVDDTILILNYAIIKSKPFQLLTNTKYMKLFIGEKENYLEGNQLAQLVSICEFIEKVNNERLYNVTKEEYESKCNELEKTLINEMDAAFLNIN